MNGGGRMAQIHEMNVSNGDVMEVEMFEEESSMDSASTVIYRTVLPIICTFGILGIALTLVVLSRKSMRTSTNCYLMALSVADLAFLVLLASLFAHGGSHDPTFHIYAAYATIMTNVALMASIWLTVLLAVERYVAICRPFLAARVCTVRVATVAIGIVAVLALVVRLPNFWEHRIRWYRDPSDGNRSVAYVAYLPMDETYVRIYSWLVDGALASILPFVALLVLNASLVREVRRSTRYLQHHIATMSATAQREELQVSIMLISIVVVFFICQAPYVVYTAMISIRLFSEPTTALMLFQLLAVLLLALKSAVNFIVYCWFSEKFRVTLGRVFHLDAVRRHCCRCCLPHTGTEANYCSVGMQTIAIQIGND